MVGFETDWWCFTSSISLEGIQCDMPKCLLSESTVFTYLLVFKIFVKSYKKNPSNDQIWAHSIYYPVSLWAKICDIFSNILSFIVPLPNPIWYSEKSSALSRNYCLFKKNKKYTLRRPHFFTIIFISVCVALDRTKHGFFFLPNIFIPQSGKNRPLWGWVAGREGRRRWGSKGQDFLKTLVSQLQELILLSSVVSFTKNSDRNHTELQYPILSFCWPHSPLPSAWQKYWT